MSSEQEPKTEIPETVSYQPLPNIYRAFAAGAGPYAIITEAIDNSIDYARSRALDGEEVPDPIQVDIRYESGEKEDGSDERLVIEDNAGGVAPDDLQRFFQLGYTDTPHQSIGTFGVGAKRLIGLGDRLKYESRARGHDVGVGFEVDAAGLQNEDNEADEEVYQSDTYRVSDLDEGATRIIVEDLESGVWDTLIEFHNTDDNFAKDEEPKPEEITGADETLWRLNETYEYFLREGIDVSAQDEEDEFVDFELHWEGPDYDVDVDPPDEVELSFLPIDGLEPRRYEDMPFAENEDADSTLRVDIEVGLMTSSDAENAGLTVTMNRRNVVFRDTNNEFFSTHYFGNFREARGHGRLHCRIYIRGPSDEMPWSDLKDGLDTSQNVIKDILNVAENALSEYKRQTYPRLRPWVVEAYPPTEAHAANGGNIRIIDKSNSKINSPRFNDKPGEGTRSKNPYPERDQLTKTVRLHHELRVYYPDLLHPSQQVAYRKYFEKYYSTSKNGAYDFSDDEFAVENPIKIDEPDDGFDTEEHEVDIGSGPDPIPVVERIKELASEHVNLSREISEDTEGCENWALPRYKEELLRANGSTDLSGFTVLNEVEDPLQLTDEGKKEEKNTNGTEASSSSEETTDTSESPTSSSTSDETSSENDSDRTSEASNQTSSSSSGETESTSASTSADGVESSSDTSSTDESGSEEKSDSDKQSGVTTTTSASTTETSDSSASFAQVDGPAFTYNDDTYDVPEEEIDTVLKETELDESASAETLFTELVEAVKQVTEQQQQIQELETELEETQTELDGTQDELEDLRDTLREKLSL